MTTSEQQTRTRSRDESDCRESSDWENGGESSRSHRCRHCCPHLLPCLLCLCVDIYSCVPVFECLCFLETLPHNISTQTNSVTGATPPPVKTLTGGDTSQCTLRCQRSGGSNEGPHAFTLKTLLNGHCLHGK